MLEEEFKKGYIDNSDKETRSEIRQRNVVIDGQTSKCDRELKRNVFV
jgi:hypothetical protein